MSNTDRLLNSAVHTFHRNTLFFKI